MNETGKYIEVMAVMKHVDFGCRDLGRPCLWFNVRMLNGGALQILEGQEAMDFVRDTGVYSISQLEGKPCVVETDGYTVRFRRLL